MTALGVQTRTRADWLRSRRVTVATGRDGDAGTLTAFALLFLVALFALVGLVVDGGVALTAHQSAAVEAEQAARAGAGSLDVDALRNGIVRVDPLAAVAAAQQFAGATGHPGTATVASGTVTVHVAYSVPTVVLGIIGVRTIRVSAAASAANLHGVTVGVR